MRAAAFTQGFEFDCGLAFVTDALADADQGGDGIEEPAHAAGFEAIQVALQLAFEELQIAGGEGGDAGKVGVPRDSGGAQVRQCSARGRSHGCVAARHGNVAQVGEAFEGIAADDQHFPAPDSAVGAVTGAVESDAYDRSFQRKRGFGDERSNMRVMVLDGLEFESFSLRIFRGPVRRMVAGMKVADDTDRFDTEEPQHMIERSLEGALGFESAHVADVLAQISEVALRDTKGGFQFGADSEYARRLRRKTHGHGCVAARTPQGHFAAFKGADHGIVADYFDVAIVSEKCVGEMGEALAGFGVLANDGLAGGIGGSHHKRVLADEQMMQRRVGQHHPYIAIAGRHELGKRAL